MHQVLQDEKGRLGMFLAFQAFPVELVLIQNLVDEKKPKSHKILVHLGNYFYLYQFDQRVRPIELSLLVFLPSLVVFSAPFVFLFQRLFSYLSYLYLSCLYLSFR